MIENRDKDEFVKRMDELITDDKKKEFSNYSVEMAQKYSKDNIKDIWIKFIDNIGENNV